MNSLTDQQLLRNYAETRSETAFTEIVRRHVDLVYSAAARMVRDVHLAEDVTQNVFVALAKDARELASRPVLSGWLHRTTQNIAAQMVRTDVRRRAREQEAVAMNELFSAETDATWQQTAPQLDIAVSELVDTDRDAVMLRYFERKLAAEIAQILGISDEAAQKRVSRAVERLREFLAKRGITVGTSALAVAITTNAVQAAPIALATTVTIAAALGGSSVAATMATQTTATTMSWLNTKSIAAIVAAAVAAGTGTHLVQQHEATNLRTQKQAILAEKANVAAQLTRERDAALSVVAANRDEIDRLQKNQAELLRLRSEVGQMRRQLLSQKAPTNPPPVGQSETSRTVSHPPGVYITKDQLAFVGYGTPEAALETITWTTMNGTYDQVNEGLTPESRSIQLKNTQGREQLEAQRARVAPLFKGIQIVAKKQINEDKVELKMKYDFDPEANQSSRPMPEFMVQPMVRVGDTWKLGGSTREHFNAWDKDGQIQTFTP